MSFSGSFYEHKRAICLRGGGAFALTGLVEIVNTDEIKILGCGAEEEQDSRMEGSDPVGR